MRRVWCIVFIAFVTALSIAAQSSDANFPTQLRTNTVNGVIKPRAIGDSRLTTYYYAFNGDQGDIFVSVITKNFDGDIDVFAVSGMRQLTKLVVYSDGNVNETGRLIYLRKPEKLLLRIQGRPPGDVEATFQVKFGGSFIASTDAESEAAPTVAVVPVKPPTPKVEVEKNSEKEKAAVASVEKKTETKPERKPKVEVPKEKTPTFEKVVPRKKEVAKKPEAATPKTTTTTAKKPDVTAKPTPDPLAKYSLVILFKNGDKLDKPMTEVERVTVEGVNLVVILKSGVITTYSLLTVEKFTID